MKKLLTSLLIVAGTTTYTFAQVTDTYPLLAYEACISVFNDFQEVIDDLEDWTASTQDYYDAKSIYVDCHDEEHETLLALLDDGEAFTELELYDRAMPAYRSAYQLFVDAPDDIERVLIQTMIRWWRQHYRANEYDQVHTVLAMIEPYDPTEDQLFSLWYLRAGTYLSQWALEESDEAAGRAQKYVQDDQDQALLDRLSEHVGVRLEAPTNDAIGWKQFWLEAMAIPRVWKSLSDPYEVVIAVIDTGVDPDHPDMEGQLRTNEYEIPDNNYDDDGNGYIDDVGGWNFVKDSGNMRPLWPHGTTVAGVLGAVPDNNLGIAGIARNVKIMPIIMCEDKVCYNRAYLGQSIRYAVDNGADIINISLSAVNGSYLDSFTEAMLYAHERGVVVVVAAGNGVWEGEEKTGVNTSVQLVSPVCNELQPWQLIWVWSVDEDGIEHVWSNYGDCVDVRAYWEGVVSTSIGQESGTYVIADGTSLATPLVAGVIWLGYNTYGHISPRIVYDALLASRNTSGIPQADVYIEELAKRHVSATQSAKLDLVRNQIHRIVMKKNPVKQRQTRNELLVALDTFEPKLIDRGAHEKLALLWTLRERIQQQIQ